MEDLALKSLQLLEQKHKTDIAALQLMYAQMSLLPHSRVPVSITRDGSRWVCTFACHPDPMKCVIAYGESPSQACLNFDHLWNGSSEFLVEKEEEEEEF